MKIIETVIEPYTWNYTQPRTASFSRILKFDTNMTGAEYTLELSSVKGSVKGLVSVIGISAAETLVKISLSSTQLANLAPVSRWSLSVKLGASSFVCWVGTFTLRAY
jgi:hypothetical protein